MWPFTPFKSGAVAKQLPQEVIEDAIDELGLVKLNRLNEAVEHALQKHLDPHGGLLYGLEDDTGGHFHTEFNLIATAGRMKALYRREPWVYTTSSVIARVLSTVPYQVKDRSTGEIDDHHPLNKMINAGNVIQDHRSMDWGGNLDLVLSGNFIQIIDGQSLLHVPIEYVRLEPSESPSDIRKFGPIRGITINDPTSGLDILKERFIEWSDVIHFKLPNPYNPFVGFSMIAAASRPILLDRHKNEFEMSFYLRGATNAGVIETTEDITKTRMDRLMRTFESAFTGRRNWFRQLFLPKGAKWVNAGLTMAEMEHLEGLRENRLTLLAVIGVPPSQVGIVQDVNRATSEQQERTFWQNTIMPLAHMKAAGWNNSYLVRKIYREAVEVVPNFDGIDAVEGGLLTRAEQAKALDNIATINEQRQLAGLSPLRQTDPRGSMFLIELVRASQPNPFSVNQPSREPNDMGPDDEPVGETRIVEVGPGGEDHPHTHNAEIDELGNGHTISTESTEGEVLDPHEHEILQGIVQPAGEDGHSHPDVDISFEEEKIFRALKAGAIGSQERIENRGANAFHRAYERYLEVKIQQAKKYLRQGFTDMRTAQAEGLPVRQDLYQRDVMPILQDTMERSFTLAQSQTRSFSPARISRKQVRFSPIDDLAIDIIKERTADDKRRTLAERNIQTFLGFDETATENIQQLVEEGLAQGLTTEAIARTISDQYGERYSDQAFTIARTETLTAVSQGIAWQHEVLGTVFSETAKQWFHVGDAGSNPDARVEHAGFEKAGNKGVVPSNFTWHNPKTGADLRYPRDPNAGANDIINCRCTMVTVIPKTAQSNADRIVGRT